MKNRYNQPEIAISWDSDEDVIQTSSSILDLLNGNSNGNQTGDASFFEGLYD